MGFKIPLQSKKEKKEKEVAVKKKAEKKINYFNQHLLPFIRRIIRSIQVKKFWIDMDTDDVVLNAQLVPVCFFMSHGPIQFNINNSGRMAAEISAQIRINRIVWAIILFITKTKFYGNEF